ncbi:MAG: hypothetical protein ABIP81_03710 [Terriglobales bacterium]
MKIVVPVLLVAAVLMIAAPRTWVKNKKARLIYQGHAQDSFLLFHGSGGRLLITSKIPTEPAGFLYDPQRGLATCSDGAFFSIKLVIFETRTSTRCTWFRAADEAKVSRNSLQFLSPRGAKVEVLWQDPPR